MRLNGWEARLNAVVERHRVLPFGWHTSDCFTLPLDGVVAITGRDPWHGLHDYSDALSAARCMRRAGFASIADYFASAFDEVSPLFAQRGDVGVIENADAICAGGLSGALVSASGFVAKTECGLLSFPRERVKRAFHIR